MSLRRHEKTKFSERSTFNDSFKIKLKNVVEHDTVSIRIVTTIFKGELHSKHLAQCSKKSRDSTVFNRSRGQNSRRKIQIRLVQSRSITCR